MRHAYTLNTTYIFTSGPVITGLLKNNCTHFREVQLLNDLPVKRVEYYIWSIL